MISENKLHHTIQVARVCYRLAKEAGMQETKARAAFVMGFLHDIGYEYLDAGDDVTKHAEISAALIDAMAENFPEIRDAVATHGTCTAFTSEFSRILNTADMSVMHDGTECSVEERVAGIKAFHGTDSSHTKHARAMARLINENKM